MGRKLKRYFLVYGDNKPFLVPNLRFNQVKYEVTSRNAGYGKFDLI